MAYDYQGAIKAGANPDDVLNYMASQTGYKAQEAIKAGANRDDVLKYMANIVPKKPVEPVQAPVEQPSGLQSFVQGVAKAPLKILSSVQELGRGLSGVVEYGLGNKEKANQLFAEQDKIKSEGIDYGYFGNVKPLSSIKEAIGTGAEIGSYAIGGGGAVSTIGKGLKGQIVKGLASGAKTGAASGGLLSFGDSMQEAESKPMDIAYNTLFGTAIGGVAGGALGSVTPAVVKGTQEALKFTKVPELQNKLTEGLKKIFNPTARQIKADTRFGNDSFKFLAEEMPDIPVTVNSAGRIEADNAIEMAKMKYAAEAAAYKPIIRNSGKYIDIDEVVAQAKVQAKKEFDGSDAIRAEQQIDDEINAYLAKTPQDINVTANGKRFVTLARADDIKSYSWARGKGWGTPEAEVWNDTNNIIGHTIKDAIEKELPDVRVKEMNRRLGQWKNAIDLLEKRQGQVSGTGGKLSKLLSSKTGTIAGSIIGASTDDNNVIGGVSGAGVGFMTATALARMMANPKVRLFAVRQILQRLQKAGRQDMIQEAEQILQQQSAKYLLPAKGGSSYVEKPILVAQPGQKIETTGIQPVAQSSSLSKNSPNATPTNTAQINSNIPNTVDQNINKASQQGGQQALLQEAKKYKTAEEFVKAQYTSKTVTVWNKSKFSNDGAYADIPVTRRVDNITLYQGGSADGRQFWTSNKKYAESFGKITEKTGTFYKVDNGNRVTDVYVEAPTKSQLTDIWNKANKK